MNTQTTSVELAQFDQLFQAAETNGPSITFEAAVPDGDYRVVVTQVDLTRARSSGNPMLVWRLRIVDGACDGRVLTKYRAITDRTIPFVKEELAKCALTLDKLSDLPRHIAGLAGRELRIQKRSQGESVNIFFQWAGPRLVETDNDLPF